MGAAFAAIAQRRPAFERVVLADVALERVRAVVDRLGEPARFSAERVDASNQEELVELIGRVRPDAVLNACDPRFNEPIFGAAFEAKVTYLDMAMTLSRPHPERPTSCPGRCSASASWPEHERWEQAGCSRSSGSGVEPGLSDVFAALRRRRAVLERRRGRRARRRRPRRRGLRLRADVLDLDDDRGVPEPAADLGARARLLHDRAVLRARGVRVPRGDRAGASA